MSIAPLHIVADEHIPLVGELFSPHASITIKPGDCITAEDLVGYSNKTLLLMVRTITSVDERLLKNSEVRWVGTASAGYDHMDVQWLSQQHIPWSYAPGCNAQAVAEYVIFCIASLKAQGWWSRKPNFVALRAGIIGVGQAGSAVAKLLSALGMALVYYDPPRAIQAPGFQHSPLDTWRDLDLICIHAPLIKEGNNPTYHLVTSELLARQAPNCVLLNAGRGDVVTKEAILSASAAVLDVWPDEPSVNTALIKQCKIATPHIAGYSERAKFRASIMLYRQASQLFQLPPLDTLHEQQWLNAYSPPLLINASKQPDWHSILLGIENLNILTSQMQATFANQSQTNPNTFYGLRRAYKKRPEFSQCHISGVCDAKIRRWLCALGFSSSR